MIPRHRRSTLLACRGGMTLIEVLFCLSVVMVMFGLFLAGAQHYVERARTVQCLANLRSIGFPLLDYTRDQGGVFRHIYIGTGTEYSTWPVQLRNAGFLSAEDLRRLSCPAHSGPVGNSSHYGFYMGDPEGRVVASGPGRIYAINVVAHPAPGRSIFLADSLNSANQQTVRIFKSTIASDGSVHTRHDGMANLFFLDGHAESAGKTRLSELGITKIYNDDNRLETFVAP